MAGTQAGASSMNNADVGSSIVESEAPKLLRL